MHRNFLIISAWNTVFRKLIVAHLIKKFPSPPFMKPENFIAVFTEVRPLSLSCTYPICPHHYTLYMALVIRNIPATKTLKTVRYLVGFGVISYTCNSQNIFSPYKIYFNITIPYLQLLQMVVFPPKFYISILYPIHMPSQS